MKKIKIGAIIGLIVLFVVIILIGKNNPETNTFNSSYTYPQKGEISDNNKSYNNENLDSNLKEQLIELESILKGKSKYYVSKDADFPIIREEVDLFYSVFNTIKKIKKETPDSTKLIAKKVENVLKKVQIKEFPELRKSFIKMTASVLWKEDIYVYGNGSTIKFSGYYYSANRNIEQNQSTLKDQFYRLRFKKSEYRMYKDQSEFTYYKIPSKKDDELSGSDF